MWAEFGKQIPAMRDDPIVELKCYNIS